MNEAMKPRFSYSFRRRKRTLIEECDIANISEYYPHEREYLEPYVCETCNKPNQRGACCKGYAPRMRTTAPYEIYNEWRQFMYKSKRLLRMCRFCLSRGKPILDDESDSDKDSGDTSNDFGESDYEDSVEDEEISMPKKEYDPCSYCMRLLMTQFHTLKRHIYDQRIILCYSCYSGAQIHPEEPNERKVDINLCHECTKWFSKITYMERTFKRAIREEEAAQARQKKELLEAEEKKKSSGKK